MNNVLVTDDSHHRMRQQGMTAQVRHWDKFDQGALRDEKKLHHQWEEVVPTQKKLLKGDNVLQDAPVHHVDPKSNTIFLESGQELEQKQLVVATGINEDQDQIQGLREAITSQDESALRVGHAFGNPVQFQNRAWHIHSGLDSKSNGDLPQVAQTPSGEQVGKSFQFPQLPLATSNQISRHTLEIDPRTKTLDFRPKLAQGERFHPIDEQDKVIREWNDQFNVDNRWDHTLAKIDHTRQLLTFTDGTEVKQRYLLISPPCRPAGFIKLSGLADAEGFLDVDPQTLQHRAHKNVFGLGQCTNLHVEGGSTTFLGLMAQAEVVAHNSHQLLCGEGKLHHQDGWNASPIVLDQQHAIIAEWKYGWKQSHLQGGLLHSSVPSAKGLELAHATFNKMEKIMHHGKSVGGWVADFVKGLLVH